MLTFAIDRKLWSNPARVMELMMTGRTIPILVEILPVNFCNANCNFCFYKKTHNNEMIKTKTMLNALREMSELGVRAINWSGAGEPTLHPYFRKFTKYAYILGLKQGLFTNAIDTSRVSPELFEWIRISETDQGVKPALKAIKKWKNKTKVGYCVNLVPDYSAKRLMDTAIKVREAGADYFQARPALARKLKHQQSINCCHLESLNTQKFKTYTSRHKFKDYLNPRTYTECLGCWLCPSIHPDGRLMTCEYWFDKSHEIGDLNRQSFSEAWRNMRTITNLEGCQHCCRNHETNKFLAWLKNGGEEDADFL